MKQRAKLTFPSHLIDQPVIFTMAVKYHVTPNIRWARVTETAGEMDLEFEGAEEALSEGIRSLREQGITVQLLDEDGPK